ncbi:MAG: O-antigen ligase family protein [Comamonas sp.]|nr:O-antigen ligase family protein [Comamonas sp.]
MKIIKSHEVIFGWALGVAAILFYALFLSVKGGYIAGALLVLMLSVVTLAHWYKAPKAVEVKTLSLFLFLVGIFMSHSFDGLLTFSSEGDYFPKYVLGAFCVLGAAAVTLRPKVLAYAIAIGCVTSAVLAVVQFPVIGRAEGFTNAIRFGNIAMLMGMFCWIFSLARNFSKTEKFLLWICGSAGVVASVLSLSRGGWLILFILPFIFLFYATDKGAKKKLMVLIAVLWISLIAIFPFFPLAKDRIAEAETQITGYFEHRDEYAPTSVGARLEQWRLSWRLGWDKPLTGWGVNGIKEGRALYLEKGEAHPSIVGISHTHNEFLEMWASRGIVGVLALCAFYFIPIRIFWPKNNTLSKFSENNKNLYMSLSLIGVMLPVSYFIFGLTDVFFNLAIGHNFYIFSMVFVMASIQWLKKNDEQYSRAIAKDIEC